jgi:hypothetical protein
MTATLFRRWLFVIIAVASSPAAAATTVAVLPLGGDAAPSTRTLWTQALRAAVSGVEGHAALPASTVGEALVTAGALGAACAPTEPACIAHIGALSTANIAIGGRVDPGRDGVVLVVDAVDVARARSLRRVVFPSGAVPDAAAARLLAVRLLAPALERAFVTVRGALPGATVSIDGEVRGTTPLSAPLEVSPGRHDLVVDHIEHDAVLRAFDVSLGATAVVDVDIAETAVLPARPPTRAEHTDAGDEATPKTQRLRVGIARVEVNEGPGGFPAGTGARFAERVRAVLREVDGVEVVGDVAVTDDDSGETVADVVNDLADHALDQKVSVVDDVATTYEARPPPIDVDLRIEITITRLGNTLSLSGHGVRVNPLATRAYANQPRDVGVGVDAALARHAAPLVAAMLEGEDTGPVPQGPRAGLPPWVFATTLVAGGVGAVSTGVTGGFWLIDGRRSAPLGIACVASIAATGVLAIAAAIEAPFIE